MKIIRDFLRDFVFGKKIYPVLAGFLPALYPLLQYGTKNFDAINTESYLYLCVGLFLISPIIICILVSKTIKNKQIKSTVILLLNLTLFFYLLTNITLGLGKRYVLLALLLSVTLSYLLRNLLNKVLLIQALLFFISAFNFVPLLVSQLNYDSYWMQPKDDILNAVFEVKPNIYFIQPDGYANYKALNSDIYSFDNSSFENFLDQNNFKIYDDFRSNYYSTLSETSLLFYR